MNKYLLFRLYAPLCSWGDIAVGEIRPSFMHPSKSAVVGLLAAALGIQWDEENEIKELSANYRFAVLVESFGKPLMDYHTAQVPPGEQKYITRRDELTFLPKNELKTILSSRDYRMDALYTVALCMNGNSKWSFEEIVEKLKQPVFTTYLGRKSCPPAAPLEPQVIEANTLLDALKKAVFKVEIPRISSEGGEKNLFFEECFHSEIKEDTQYERRDIPLSRKRWLFDTRKEYHTIIGG
ncbi:MAG: type I-E CRISPR-associated protein Cas5/CasD [Elusimicrobiota bacterium]